MKAANKHNSDLARKKSLKQLHTKIKPSDSTVCNNCCFTQNHPACLHF